MKTQIVLIGVILTLLFLSRNTEAGCDFSTVPLKRSESCAEYKKEDKKLNSAYNALIKRLDKAALPELIKTQKRWLQWRNGRCQRAQIESGCVGVASNSQCVGRAYDDCIIDLTSQRTEELYSFLENPASASKTSFEFSEKNRYLDEK